MRHRRIVRKRGGAPEQSESNLITRGVEFRAETNNDINLPLWH